MFCFELRAYLYAALEVFFVGDEEFLVGHCLVASCFSSFFTFFKVVFKRGVFGSFFGKKVFRRYYYLRRRARLCVNGLVLQPSSESKRGSGVNGNERYL